MPSDADMQAFTTIAADLGEKIDGFRGELAGQRAYAERTRAIVGRVNALLTALAVVAIIAIIGVVVAIRTAGIAQANSARAVSTCQASNNARAVTLDTWNTVLSADFTSNLPTAQRAAADDRLSGLRGNLAKVLKQQDCTKLAK